MTDSEKLDLILSEMQGMKTDMQGVKTDMQELNRRVTGIELYLENGTDKNPALEVKVNYLMERVQVLEKEVAELKSKIA